MNCYSKIKNNIYFLIAKVYTDFGLNDIKNEYAVRNKEPAKLIKTMDKIEEDGNLK